MIVQKILREALFSSGSEEKQASVLLRKIINLCEEDL